MPAESSKLWGTHKFTALGLPTMNFKELFQNIRYCFAISMAQLVGQPCNVPTSVNDSHAQAYYEDAEQNLGVRGEEAINSSVESGVSRDLQICCKVSAFP